MVIATRGLFDPFGHNMRTNKYVWLVFLVCVLATVALGATLNSYFPEVLAYREHQVSIGYLLSILVFIGFSSTFRNNLRVGKMLKQLSIWLAIGIFLIAAFSFRHDLYSLASRLLGELVPSLGVKVRDSVSVPASKNGHYFILANIKGVSIRFLVDTGASDIILTRKEASRIGFDVDKLKFSKIYSTANGKISAAPVSIKRINIGPFAFKNVSASVNAAEMEHSLLGMTFLDLLSSYEVRDGWLTIRQ